MRFRKMRKAGATRHRGSDRDQLLIVIGEFRQRLADDLGIGWRWRRGGLAAVDLVFAKAMKFIRLLDRRFVAFAFFRQNVQEHRLVLRFQEFKGADQERDVVSIDRSVVAPPQPPADHASADLSLY